MHGNIASIVSVGLGRLYDVKAAATGCAAVLDGVSQIRGSYPRRAATRPAARSETATAIARRAASGLPGRDETPPMPQGVRQPTCRRRRDGLRRRGRFQRRGARGKSAI